MRELPSRPARSWLFVPGANDRFVAKLAEVRPDAVVLDLEDGVAADDLHAARERVARLLTPGSGGDPWLPKVVALRTHAASDPQFADDLRSAGPRLDLLIVPKASSAGDVAAAAAALEAQELRAVGVVPLIESAAGLTRVDEILAQRSVIGVAFGGEDFAADLGLPPALSGGTGVAGGRHEREEDVTGARLSVLDHARARIVIAASAAGSRYCIDTPLLQIRPFELAVAAARRSRAQGFNGKLVIHPAHVQHVHEGFRPSQEEVLWARRLVGAGAGGSRLGASSVDGRMIDEAVLRQARSVLAASDED